MALAAETAKTRQTPATVVVVQPVKLALPIRRYVRMWDGAEYCFFLDSALNEGRLGRFSFVGGDPAAVLMFRRQAGHVLGAPGEVTVIHHRAADGLPIEPPRMRRFAADPFLLLHRWLAHRSPPQQTESAQPHEVPFGGGLVGYLGYELLHFIENVPPAARRDVDLPDGCLMVVDSLLAHDHDTNRSYVCALGQADHADQARSRARRTAAALLDRVRHFEPDAPGEPTGPQAVAQGPVGAFFDRDGYGELVRTAKDHIAAGDAFEICLTHRLDVKYTGDPWALYCHLRRINPAPFAAYLRLPEATILCASPERFLRLRPDGWAEARPIKGTRPRGLTPQQDRCLRDELAHSEKDRAENAMIVDLLRNDLGRVCRFGTIGVENAMSIEAYASVFQMVSTVRGRLRPECDAVDLLRACFPGGSMTGAPKVEAMKIINRLEPVARGVYSGAIGYFDAGGGMDLNIVIRTILMQNGRAYLNVGGAVVADSDPLAEYDETMDKAQALLQALRGEHRVRPCRSDV
ncbi:MAG TPA: aminodeoxychorismate synthase component I [Phycisphaerae bacterium]|nr:aminodeoxychorismate synthase component I [Phycisphaerae bacterium]